jgi:ligand-binding sensor domain-containing protein
MKEPVTSLLFLLLLFTSLGTKAQDFTNFTSADGLPSDVVTGVAIDGNNVKWFATLSGVARFNDTAWTVYKLSGGLIDTNTTCIAADASNNIWVGTYSGVSKYDGTNWTSYTSADGLVNDMVNYILADHLGNIWFGTNGGLSKFDGTTWTNFTSSSGLPADMVSYLACDASNNIWIGTSIGGLAVYDGTTFTTYTTADSLPENNINAIAIDSLGYKYIGTYSGGIAVFNSSNLWVKTLRATDGLYNNYIQDLAINQKQNLWVGAYADYQHEGGITKYDGSTYTSYSDTNGLVNVYIKRIAVDQQNNLWIATAGGVSKFTDKNLGVENLSKTVWKIYPNPATANIYINCASSLNVVIMDITGKKLMERFVATPSSGMDVSMLNPGIYFVTLTMSGKQYVSKLIIR